MKEGLTKSQIEPEIVGNIVLTLGRKLAAAQHQLEENLVIAGFNMAQSRDGEIWNYLGLQESLAAVAVLVTRTIEFLELEDGTIGQLEAAVSKLDALESTINEWKR